MTAKKQQKPNKNTIVIEMLSGEDLSVATARTLAKPRTRAAATIQKWNQSHTVYDLSNELKAQIAEVNKGDMRRAEAMLWAQANTLDELFNNLARRAHGQTGLAQFETMFRLALKAQTQCRATIETLSNIKNPPIVYAKQANFASGHQQVNNGVPAHVGKSKNQQNELLSELPNETLDKRRTGETIAAYPAMAALD